MAKTRIAPDLLSELPATKASLAEAAPETESPQAKTLIAVIIEMNAGFPWGVRAARAMLLYAFLKEQTAAGVKIPEAALARRSLVRLRPPALPADIDPVFDPVDRIAIANSLYTDNYLFGELTVETINRLAPLAIDTGGGTKVSPIYKLWRDHKLRRSCSNR